MGGALVTLGLLGGCGWDDDSSYFPRRVGFYLRAGQHFWWVPDDGQATLLPFQIRSLSSTPWGAAALDAQGETLYIFSGGKNQPTQTISLGEKCFQVRGFFERPALCLSCESGIRLALSRESSFSPQWERLPNTAGLTQLAAANSFLIAGSKNLVKVFEPQGFLEVATWSIPGYLDTLWIEHPTGAGGRWHTFGGTPSRFSYLHPARLFTQDTTEIHVLFRQTSPYLKRTVGTEYLGEASLLRDSSLYPGGHVQVRSFSTDFLSGKVLFLRRDSVWEYAVGSQSDLRFVGRFGGATEIEAAFVYRYGSTEATIR